MSGKDKGVTWDAAEFLTTPEAAKAYLDAALEECGDDPQFIAHALGVVARSGNLSAIARETGVTREGLYKSLSTTGNPSFATIVKVANSLGLHLRFEPAQAAA